MKKPLRDSSSDPLSLSEIEYMDTRAADHRSSSPYSTRGQRAGRFLSKKPSLTSMTTYDAESQCSLAAPRGPDRAVKGSARPDRTLTSCTVSSQLQKQQLEREPSSSTLRSYYDRTKSPLAVSQQTSASSARDFALRKGCPPVIPGLRSDMSGAPKAGSAPFSSRGPPKKRPSRLDFSMLFPKPLPRSGPILSPQRYTASPPPLSATSEVPFREFPNQSSLNNQEASGAPDLITPRHPRNSCQPLENADKILAKTNPQKPRLGVQNWFDGLEIDISEDDADCEPDMQPNFVETAFRTPPIKFGEAAFRSPEEPSKPVRPNHGTEQPSFAGRECSVSRRFKPLEDGQPREKSRKWEMKAENVILPCYSRIRAPSTLGLADLSEQSVLCLSSSDDEEDNTQKGEQRRNIEQRGPSLRDSLGADSIDSDVEIGTAQAVDTSFLRMVTSPDQSSDLNSSSSLKRKSNVQRLKAVDIPERGSSRQAVPSRESQLMASCFDGGVPRDPFLHHGDRESLSTSRSTRTSPAMSQRQGPLVMALTPQEASLLEAMRSKRATMRQYIVAQDYRDAADEGTSSIAALGRQRRFDRSFWSRSADKRPVLLTGDAEEVKKKCSAIAASTEQSVPSGRVSLIFSESVSSPTTGRDSPATPTLDTAQDLRGVQNLADYHNGGLHQAKSDPFSHSRCRTGSTQIFALDNFDQRQKESPGSGEYPWVYDGLARGANSAMIH
jgi:hypothetical protein